MTCSSWFELFHCCGSALTNEAKAFSICRWQTNERINGWFITYRIVLAAWSFGVLIVSLAQDPFVLGNTNYLKRTNRGYLEFWPIYLTNLGFLGLTVHLILAAAIVIERLIDQRDGFDEARMTSLIRISWPLSNVITVIALINTCTYYYWYLFYNPGKPEDMLSIMKHGINSIVIMVDIFISARPWKLLHFYQSMMAPICYTVFGYTYWMIGGTNEHGKRYIYEYFDFNDDSTVWPRAGLVLVLALTLHAFIWFLHILRDSIGQKMLQSEPENKNKFK